MSIVSDRNEGTDMVNHPPHYADVNPNVECIEIAREFNFNCGNVIKYLWRAGVKAEAGLAPLQKELEDLEKAKFYLSDEINRFYSEHPPNTDIYNASQDHDYVDPLKGDVLPHIVNQDRRKVISHLLRTRASSWAGNTHLISAMDWLNNAIEDVKGKISNNEKLASKDLV
jgi:hypothetical protein